MLATDARDAVSGVHVDDAGYISDHRLVLAKVKFSRPVCRAIKSTYRNIQKINLSAFESALFQSTSFSSPAGTADEFAEQVAEVVASELDKVTPVKKCKRRPPNSITKWLSTEPIVAKRERRRFEKRWKTSGKKHDRVLYRRCCRSTNELILDSRRDSFQNRLQKCRSSGEQWKVVKELLHSSDGDKSRCESENLSLCSTFSSFYNKIQSLKLAISIKLSTFHYSSTPSDQPHTASTLSSFPPVITAEALTIINLSFPDPHPWISFHPH